MGHIVFRRDVMSVRAFVTFVTRVLQMLHLTVKFTCKFTCIQSTLVISNSKGLTETLRDIRTSTYQS